MNSKTIPLFPFSVIFFCFTLANAATFNIRNNCKYTVWAAATPGGGKQVNSGETWDLDVADGTARARIWARTNCYFDGNERGSCQTGDCGGLLQCQDYGSAPNTLVQYSLNQYDNLDYFDISLVEGFNVPVELSSTSAGCSKDIRCSVNITAECPDPLKTPGGCHNPCTVYKSDMYCCNSGNCVPTDFSNFFKARCPNAYSYPKDDQTSLFTCPAGTNYLVVFCP